MRRVIKTLIVLTLFALAAVAVSTGGSAAPKKPSSTAAAPSADRPTLMKQHRGGTLKLVAKAAGGTIDPHVNYTLQYWQLYQATYDGLLAFKKAGGNAAFQVVPDLATAIPTPTNGGKTWTFKLRKRDQVLERPGGDHERRRRLAQAHLQGQEPDLGWLLRRHRRRRRVPEDARHLHAQGRRLCERRGGDGHDQPQGARPGVQVQARRPAREHPAGEHAAEGRRHEADSRHGPVHVQVVQPEPAARAGPQPLLQGVVGQGAARRLPGPDHAELRAHRRGADHGDPERAGRLDARAAARRPALARSARSTRARSMSTR